MKGSLVFANDVMKSDVIGDQFGGISSKNLLRDGSSEVNNIFSVFDLMGGLGNAQKTRRGLRLLKELPMLDETGKIHTNTSSLPKIKELIKYPIEELTKFLKDLRISVKNRIRTTSVKGPNANRLQNRSHGQRQGAEQDLIKSLEKHLEDQK